MHALQLETREIIIRERGGGSDDSSSSSMAISGTFTCVSRLDH